MLWLLTVVLWWLDWGCMGWGCALEGMEGLGLWLGLGFFILVWVHGTWTCLAGLVRYVLGSCDTICLGPLCGNFARWKPCWPWFWGYMLIDLWGRGTKLPAQDLVVSSVGVYQSIVFDFSVWLAGSYGCVPYQLGRWLTWALDSPVVEDLSWVKAFLGQ